MSNLNEDDIESLKRRLKDYSIKEISFNEPHFTQQLTLREGSKKDVVHNLLNPDKLIYSYQESGKYGETIHCLHFNISNTRTMRLPIIFNPHGKKGLYMLTYIMRYRPWQNMIKGRFKNG